MSRGDRSIGQVARDYDLTEKTVREWFELGEINDRERPGLTLKAGPKCPGRATAIATTASTTRR